MKYTNAQLRHLDELAHTKLLNLPESKLGERCPNCGGETRLGINRAWCFNESEWIYSPYSEYTESLDMAFRLDKAAWRWDMTEQRGEVEPEDDGGWLYCSVYDAERTIHDFVAYFADFPDKAHAYAFARTVVALKAVGIDVEIILEAEVIA